MMRHVGQDRVRVAVVGFGYWGPNLLRNMARLGGPAELAVCCDLDESKLASVRKIYPGLETSTSYEGVLARKDIDAIVLATPARTHYSLGAKALASGKHLLAEKPLAMTRPECEELIRLAEERHLVLMVGHTFLYNNALLKVKELAQPEHIGDLFYLYSHRVNLGQVQSDINALWSIAPHDISIALFLHGGVPSHVSAQGASYLNASVEDVVFLTMTFPDGVVGHIHVSWIDPSKTRRVTVVGSKKMIIYDDLADEGKVKVYDKAVSKVQNADAQLPSYGAFHYRLHSGDIYAPKVEMVEPLAKECQHFIDCIVRNERPISDGWNGLAVVSVLECAQRSLESHGDAVSVQPLDRATPYAVLR
jgi:predicted dehydrogenase